MMALFLFFLLSPLFFLITINALPTDGVEGRRRAGRRRRSLQWSCEDNYGMTFVEESTGEKRKCDWLRAQLDSDPTGTVDRTYCNPPEGYRTPLAAVVCPRTCDVPSCRPTGQEGKKCRDTSAVVGTNKKGRPKKCGWIANPRRSHRIDKYCSTGTPGFNSRADVACPKTCGKCDEPTGIIVPTPAPPSCPALDYSSHDEDTKLRMVRSGRPDRFFRIYTPPRYDKTRPSRVVFMYHGWTTGTYCKGSIFLSGDWRDYADERNYVLVAVDGLADNDDDNPRSFTFPGSADGIGRDGRTVTTCDDGQSGPDYCYESCGNCPSRCGWTHCRDDDIRFFVDLVEEISRRYVCVDPNFVFAYGYSMGGMFAWSLAQDPTSAPLLAGIGAVMGLPMHDYLVGKGVDPGVTLPAIGIYGEDDCSVPPGDGSREYNEVCDGDGYYYVDAWHLHRLWASDHRCDVGSAAPGWARYEYEISGRDELTCWTHCDPGAGPPASLDCRVDDGHGKEPWHLDAVLKFFDQHYPPGPQ